MKRNEVLFLAAVLAMGAAFAVRAGSEAVRSAGWGASEEVPAGAAGRPRDVDMGKLRRLTEEGLLSEREALFYRKLAVPSRPGAEEGVVAASRKVRVLESDVGVTVVLSAARKGSEGGALGAAEEALRRADGLLGPGEGSEVSRLNAAGPGPVRVSGPLMQVLRTAREVHQQSLGAFDVTGRPLVELWRRAGGGGRLPGADEIAGARARSSWDALELTADGIVKKGAGAGVDLGAVARGHALDRAIEELLAAGAAGGRVDAGGEARVFGRSPEGGPWRIAVRHPYKQGDACARLSVSSGAVCTAGPERGFVEIGGKRYGLLLDPRTGRPAEGGYSATVAAPSAVAAGAWAAALSVLGPSGLELLPQGEGFEGLVIGGPPESPRAALSPGFRALLVSGPDFR